MQHSPILSTERLALEPVTAAHAREAWPGLNDEGMWTFFPELRPRSLEHLQAIYERREHGSRDASQVWLNYLVRERASGALTGEVQATVLLHAGVSYVAYDTFREHRRKGYAREAMRALIAHVRGAYGIRRFLAEMDTRNEASYKLAESLDFVRIETHRSVDRGNGFVSDEYVYELKDVVDVGGDARFDERLGM